MLIDIDTDRPIQRIPYRADFEFLCGRLSEAEFQGMVDRINELIDESGGEIATAGWLPGSDWTGTPFEPIYTKAARGDFERAAKFFGQLVWYTVMKRPECWASGRYQLDGKDIGSRTYFRLRIQTDEMRRPRVLRRASVTCADFADSGVPVARSLVRCALFASAVALAAEPLGDPISHGSPLRHRELVGDRAERASCNEITRT